MDALSKGCWADDPEFSPPKDPEQLHDFAKLMVKIAYIGKHGEPQFKADVNHLDDGIWEFRHGARRLTYWDTPGDGSFTPKPKIDDRRTAPNQGSDAWWYPDLDAVLRLGPAWPKTGQKAPRSGIQAAVKIRLEDCDHDYY